MIRGFLSDYKLSFALATVILLDLVISYIKISYFGYVEVNPLVLFIGFGGLVLVNIVASFSLFILEWALKRKGIWESYKRFFEFLLIFRASALLLMLYLNIFFYLKYGGLS